ncbi:VacJ family lipoprotein [Dokdonella sp.]|uniref:MlaA family lipoprotein n=1 Tax=Dokdonella sp. TaxID=2291710 RepID=UPI0031BEC59C|nr:VacJ family lipoprotein [Dokdonella sp.]
MRPAPAHPIRAACIALCLIVLAGCTIAQPRTDDPWEGFNRKMYVFNDAADKAVIRPLAVTYRKVTTPNMRRVVDNFFANIKLPISIINDVLQGRPAAAAHNTARFVVNSTAGLVGLFDPASKMNLPGEVTDFGVTLARWGVPEGPYLVLPLVGPTTARDVWRLPVDNYFDPLGWYQREHDLAFKAEYLPNFIYLITLRSRGIDAESLMQGVYDPYIFYRDAYRQRRLYEIYNGNPPVELIEQLQLQGNDIEDIDQLLEEQRAYERGKHDQPPKP